MRSSTASGRWASSVTESEFEREVETEMARLEKQEKLEKPLLSDLPDTPLKPLLEYLIAGEDKESND